MKRINIAYITKDLPVNGISTVVMNYCRYLNKDLFEITVFSGEPIDEKYLSELEGLGVKVKKMPKKRKKTLGYYKFLLKELKGKNYNIVHVHGNSATITIELFIAWINHIKVRIAHSHNSTCDNKKVDKILKPVFRKMYTHGFACSNIAGKWMFGKKEFKIIPNGFDTKKFIYNSEIRNKVRRELKIDNKFVIGHIGRFNEQKNHPYLLQIFEEVAKKNENAYLLLIGTGPDLDKIKKIINNHKYSERIIYYGVSDNVSELYNAMDVFVFPSKYEGLGIVLLEAQINGLPCVSSDVVPAEVILSKNMKTISLNNKISEWADSINKSYVEDRETFYKDNIDLIKQYEIKDNILNLEKLYIDYTNKK